MSNYSSQTLPPSYLYPIIRQYTPQSYYYSFNEYSSSPLLSRISYTPTLPHDGYTSSFKYYDDEEAFLSEYYHHHHHHHRQYSHHRKPNRARNTSR